MADKLEILTSAQLLELYEKEKASLRKLLKSGFKVGQWEFIPSNLTLLHKESDYEVDLQDMTTSAAVLDWIAQVDGKDWATPATVGDLVRIVNTILDLQANYCSMGKERGPVNVAKLIRPPAAKKTKRR